jgi:hypothetical protein
MQSTQCEFSFDAVRKTSNKNICLTYFTDNKHLLRNSLKKLFKKYNKMGRIILLD